MWLPGSHWPPPEGVFWCRGRGVTDDASSRLAVGKERVNLKDLLCQVHGWKEENVFYLLMCIQFTAFHGGCCTVHWQFICRMCSRVTIVVIMIQKNPLAPENSLTPPFWPGSPVLATTELFAILVLPLPESHKQILEPEVFSLRITQLRFNRVVCVGIYWWVVCHVRKSHRLVHPPSRWGILGYF